jgi:uncharacterized membrane protein YfcA
MGMSRYPLGYYSSQSEEPRHVKISSYRRKHEMMSLAVGLAILVGISLGLLGGGGSILTVPLLVYVAGVDAKQAIATSLLVVGVASAVSLIAHARAGRVRWRTGTLFGVGGMAGAYVGGIAARFIPDRVLMVGFAVVMVAAGVAMLRARKSVTVPGNRRVIVIRSLAQGILVGLMSGMVGAGGGFLIVPALAMLGGLPVHAAVGTSLLVIAMQSFAGLGGHLASVQIDWRLAALITVAAVVGGVIGGLLTSRIDPDTLRKAFAWLIFLTASVILAEEVDSTLGILAAGMTVLAAAAMFVCGRYEICPARRLAAGA